jgi:hypothetical protein
LWFEREKVALRLLLFFNKYLKLSFVGIVMVKKDSDIGTEIFFAEMKRDKFVEHKEKKKRYLL